MRSRFILPLLVLSALSTLSLGILELDPPIAWGLSPLSPVQAQPLTPTPAPGQGLAFMLSESFWTSPLPWVAVGLILFSALAWALATLLRLLD